MMTASLNFPNIDSKRFFIFSSLEYICLQVSQCIDFVCFQGGIQGGLVCMKYPLIFKVKDI